MEHRITNINALWNNYRPNATLAKSQLVTAIFLYILFYIHIFLHLNCSTLIIHNSPNFYCSTVQLFCCSTFYYSSYLLFYFFLFFFSSSSFFYCFFLLCMLPFHLTSQFICLSVCLCSSSLLKNGNYSMHFNTELIFCVNINFIITQLLYKCTLFHYFATQYLVKSRQLFSLCVPHDNKIFILYMDIRDFMSKQGEKRSTSKSNMFMKKYERI